MMRKKYDMIQHHQILRNLWAQHHCIHNRMIMIAHIDCLTLLVMEDTTLSEAAVSEASESCSAFLQCLNRGHDIFCQCTGAQEEEDVHPQISNPPAEGDKDESSTSSARIDDALATGGWKETSPQEATPISTTACATSSSKKKKAAAQCQKGAFIKVTRSHLFHVLEHDVQKDRHLKATTKVGTSLDKFYLGVESKDTISNLIFPLQTIKMYHQMTHFDKCH
jgi:hypothetical protein